MSGHLVITAPAGGSAGEDPIPGSPTHGLVAIEKMFAVIPTVEPLMLFPQIREQLEDAPPSRLAFGLEIAQTAFVRSDGAARNVSSPSWAVTLRAMKSRTAIALRAPATWFTSESLMPH